MRPFGPGRRVVRPTAVLASLILVHVAGGSQSLFSQVPDLGGRPGEAPVSDTAAAPGVPDLYASLGLNFAAAIPFGEFSRNVSSGYGMTGDASFRLLRDGWLGLRLDGGAIWYGSETRRETVYVSRLAFEVESTTENYIAYGAVGPQVQLAGYPLSARLYGLLGLSYFETRTSARFDSNDPETRDIDLGSQSHLRDWTPSFALGGELRFAILSTREAVLLGLGLSIDWRRHGVTRYLIEGSIHEVNGRIDFEPLESRADFLLISLGVWFGTW